MDEQDSTLAEPRIDWKNADGPLLICCDDTRHLLTMHERMMLRFGFITVKSLDAQYNREPRRGW